MPTITAIVHTKNSARTLESCLASLTWCDEIFVVDMQSTDETLAIAKRYHATIFHEKQIKFADPIRATYIGKVKTDWTLIIDSDEEVPKTLAKKLRELAMTQGVNGFRIPRANIIFGRWIEHTGFWPDYIVRFFRTGSCTYPPYVHAQPIIEGVTETIEAKADYALIHHHYDSIEQYLLRLNVYTSLEVEKTQQNSKLQATDILKSFFDEFFRRFFQQKGYKDGTHGFVISLLQAIYMMVVMMKRWEQKKEQLSFSLDDVETTISDACSDTTYWVATEKLPYAKAVEKLFLRIRRKFMR